MPLVSILGESYSCPSGSFFNSFFHCFLMQRLKSAARQPWGFQCHIQTVSGSPKGLCWELRDPKTPTGEGQAGQTDNSQSGAPCRGVRDPGACVWKGPEDRDGNMVSVLIHKYLFQKLGKLH